MQVLEGAPVPKLSNELRNVIKLAALAGFSTVSQKQAVQSSLTAHIRQNGYRRVLVAA